MTQGRPASSAELYTNPPPTTPQIISGGQIAAPEQLYRQPTQFEPVPLTSAQETGPFGPLARAAEKFGRGEQFMSPEARRMPPSYMEPILQEYGVPELGGLNTPFGRLTGRGIISNVLAPENLLPGAGILPANLGRKVSGLGLTRKLPELIFSEQGAVPFIKGASKLEPAFKTSSSGGEFVISRGSRMPLEDDFLALQRQLPESGVVHVNFVDHEGREVYNATFKSPSVAVQKLKEFYDSGLAPLPGPQVSLAQSNELLVSSNPGLESRFLLSNGSFVNNPIPGALEHEEIAARAGVDFTSLHESGAIRIAPTRDGLAVSVGLDTHTPPTVEQIKSIRKLTEGFRTIYLDVTDAGKEVFGINTTTENKALVDLVMRRLQQHFAAIPEPQVSNTTKALLNLVTEESGALRIPRWVLKKAEANTAKAWEAAGLPPPKNDADLASFPAQLRERWNETVRAVAEDIRFPRVSPRITDEMVSMQSLKTALKQLAGTEEGFLRAKPGAKASSSQLMNGAIRQELSKLPIQSTAEVDAASAWQRSSNIWRGILVTQLATAVRNLETQTGRLGIDVIDQGIQAGMQKIFGKEVTADPMASLSTLGNIIHFKKTRDMLGPVFDAYPEQTAQAFRTFSSDVLAKVEGATTIFDPLLSAGEKAVALANVFNRAQEFAVRRAVIASVLESKLQAKGLSLAELGRRVETAKSINPLRINLSESDYKEAIDKALEMTWGRTPTYGSLGQKFVDFINKAPGAAIIAPFPRFMVESLKFLFDFSPVGLARVFTPGEMKNMAAGNFQNFSRGMIGLGALGGAYLLRNSNLAGPNWYDVKIPGTENMVDVRSFGPFAAYFLAADILDRAIDGTLFNPQYADDLQKAVLGIQFPSGVGLELVDQYLKSIKSIGSGDPLKALEELAGKVVSGLLTPLQTLTDIYGQFHEEARVTRNTDLEPFFGPIKARLPGLQEELPPQYLPTRKEPLTREEPLLRQLTGATIRKPTVAEQELDRLQFSRQEILSNTGVPQWDALMTRYTGELVESAFPLLLNSAGYKSQPDEVKALLLREMLTEIRDVVRGTLKEVKPDLYVEMYMRGLPNREKQLIAP